MPSTNELLRDSLLRRDIRIRKVGNSLAREALRALIELQRELEARVRARLGWIAERGYDSSSFTLRRLEANLRELKPIIAEAYRELGAGVRSGIREAARFEGAFLTAEMTRALGPAAEMLAVRGLAPEVLRAIVDARPFQGAIFKGWIQELSERSFLRFSKSMRQGMLLGESVDQLVRRTFGRAVRVGGQWIRRGGAFEATTREAETWVVSYMSHTTNSARDEFYNTNASLLKGVQVVTYLDSRVCEQCGPYDGHVYSLPDHEPLDGGPPWGAGPGRWHPRDRCTGVPIVKSLKELGLSDREDELPERFRQSMNGLVPARTTFREWAQQQGFDTQADLFGVRRARLIQQGKLDVDEMWNDKGMFLTLDKLKEAS